MTIIVPKSLQNIQVRHLFTMNLLVKPMLAIGETPGGFRRIYDRLPSPKQIQTLVQVWKQLWKWR